MSAIVRRLMRQLSAREGLDDPHPIHRALREAGPMHEAPHFGPALTRYSDVRKHLFDRSLKVSSAAAKAGSARADIAQKLPEDLRRLPAPLFLQDDPGHKRLRRLIAPAFTQSAVNALRPRIEHVTDDLLAALSAKPRFDLVAEFAAPLPARIIGHILGVADTDIEVFRERSEAIIHELHPLSSPAERSAAIAAHRALADFFRGEIAAARAHARKGLIADLVAAQAAGVEVSDDEIVSIGVNLLVAGHFTTTDLIATMAYLLLRHGDERAKLDRDPALWRNAVEETLRFEPPTPMLGRVHACPAHVHERAFEAGDSVNLFIASANRDPNMFEDPERFDVGRTSNAHLSFGGGAHFCLGAQLARCEAEIAVRALFMRMPALALAPGAIRWRRTPNFRGLAALWVAASPAPRVDDRPSSHPSLSLGAFS